MKRFQNEQRRVKVMACIQVRQTVPVARARENNSWEKVAPLGKPKMEPTRLESPHWQRHSADRL